MRLPRKAGQGAMRSYPCPAVVPQCAAGLRRRTIRRVTVGDGKLRIDEMIRPAQMMAAPDQLRED